MSDAWWIVRQVRLSIVLLGATWILAGCMPRAGDSTSVRVPSAVVNRAAFDLACPAQALQYIALKATEPRSFGVIGCYKRVTYVEMCSISGQGLVTNSSCSWTMDGPIQWAGPPPGYGPPPYAPYPQSAPVPPSSTVSSAPASTPLMPAPATSPTAPN
jgi:hypothetical protein